MSSTTNDVLMINKISGLDFTSLSMILAFFSLNESYILLNKIMFSCKCLTGMFILFSLVYCSF